MLKRRPTAGSYYEILILINETAAMGCTNLYNKFIININGYAVDVSAMCVLIFCCNVPRRIMNDEQCVHI